jgi:hypothetical protein
MKGGSEVRIVGYPHLAAMSLDDRATDRQTYPHAGGLCREECVEQCIQMRSINAGPVVNNRNQHTVASVSLRSDGQRILATADIRHCLNAVDDEVDDHLLQLNLVACDRG